MAIQHAHVDPVGDGDIVFIQGDVDEIENIIGREAADDVLVAGYSVKRITDAEHDGHPAKRITLTADRTEIGRLVLRTDVPTEYMFEFTAVFVDEPSAREFVERTKRPLAQAKVAESIQDFAFEGTLPEAIAEVSAEYGISVTVLRTRGPGGGWPEVKLIGTIANLRRALVKAWGYTELEAEAAMRPVTL